MVDILPQDQPEFEHVNALIVFCKTGDALYALKNSLVGDPNNFLQSWDSNADPCTWFHVNCDKEKRVTRV